MWFFFYNVVQFMYEDGWQIDPVVIEAPSNYHLWLCSPLIQNYVDVYVLWYFCNINNIVASHVRCKGHSDWAMQLVLQTASSSVRVLATEWAEKVTPLSTMSIWYHMNCKTHNIFILFEQLWHLLIIMHSLMCSFIWKHFHNYFGTPVFLHMQIVNQTAIIVS